MKIYPFGLTSYVMRAQSSRGKYPLLGAILRLLLVLWVAEMVAAVPAIVLVLFQHLPSIYELAEKLALGQITAEAYQSALQEIILLQNESPAFGIASYVGLAAVAGGAVLYMFSIDRRPMHQMGLVVEKSQRKHLPLFALMGVLGMCLIVLVNFVGGAVAFTPATPTFWHLGVAVAELIGSSAYLIFFLSAFLPVILSHTRGYWRGAIWASVLLGLYLAPPTSVTILGDINGILLALILVLLTTRTGSIWPALLSYGALRVLADVLFGDPAYTYLPEAILDPIFAAGRDLTHGGMGGYLSGLGATLVLALALLAVLYWPRRAPREDTSAFTHSSL